MVLKFLSEEERLLASPLLRKIHLDKGDFLFRPSDISDGVYFLEEGRLGVQTKTGFEDKQQVVALLDPGAPIGEKGLAEKGQRGMSVVAIEKTTLYFLHADDFQDLEKSHPDIAIKILKKLVVTASIRLQSSSERLAHVL